MLPASFVDEAIVDVHGGAGGSGIVSFLRTRSNPRGGPDGGNGGGGGDVLAVVDENLASLSEYVICRQWRAEHGQRGGGGNCHGAAGRKLVLAVPAGTDIYDNVTGERHASLLAAGQQTVLAHGGRGGRGNVTFKSSTNRAPRQATSGEDGERRELRFELRLLADIGMVGLPNAGKSSLLAALSAAKPAVADYPFTTLRPHLGVVSCDDLDLRRLTLADLPGIIAGAAAGAGLGLRFLRHISRAAALVHVVDCSGAQLPEILACLAQVEDELVSAGGIIGKKRVIALNKADLLAADAAAELAQQVAAAKGLPALAVSAAQKTGLNELIAAMVNLAPAPDALIG